MQKLRKRTWMGRLAAAVMAAAVLVLAGAFVSLADESGDTTRFVSGTKVNGVGVGGLTVDEAKARIEGFYAGEYNLTIRERGGRQETIAGTDIGYKVEVPEGLKAILDAQNAAGRVSGPDADNSHTMAMTVTYSQEALGARIKALTLISGSGITVTSDARISSYEEGQPFSIIPAVQGNNVDEAKTTEVITAAVKAGQNSVDVDSAGCYYQVNIWETDENLIALCSRMNQYRDMSVNYVFGSEKETLGGETIATWITGSQDGVPTVDLEKITAFVTEMASRRDTAGTARVFHTATGKDVELTGPYGWKIDQAAETAALMELVSSGSCWSEGQAQADREPVYSQKAASREGMDWGTTYVEVDLGGQHVYMFKEGQIVWDAPCVTGNVSKDYTTPSGIYSLTYKEKDRILRGKKKPDGTYEYESHVDYWMPFNGGIGLHDASWRSKFGGTLYQTGGSHGCINLPPQKAPALYDLVYKGIPVLCTP